MNISQIQAKLLNKYDILKNVHVVGYCYDYQQLKKRLGKTASTVFDDLILKYKYPRVGIGGGSTIYEFVKSSKELNRRIKIFPTALIGRGPEITYYDSSFLAMLMHLKSRPESNVFIVNIPPFPNRTSGAKKFKNYLLSNIDEVNWIYKLMNTIDIAFISVGAMAYTGDFDKEMNKLGVTIKDLSINGVVGGINYNWFTAEGLQKTDYFLTVSIDKLKELSKKHKKRIVLVAGGSHKINAIKIALESEMINTLITDYQSAKYLLNS
ncbi:sugar-binding domain-containing protein [Candidatus Neomarinimicrobiota bacterium]